MFYLFSRYRIIHLAKPIPDLKKSTSLFKTLILSLVLFVIMRQLPQVTWKFTCEGTQENDRTHANFARIGQLIEVTLNNILNTTVTLGGYTSVHIVPTRQIILDISTSILNCIYSRMYNTSCVLAQLRSKSLSC